MINISKSWQNFWKTVICYASINLFANKTSQLFLSDLNFLKQSIHDLIYFIITAVSLTSNSFSSNILIISNGTKQEKPFIKDLIWASIRDINRHWMTRLQRKTMQTSELKKILLLHTLKVQQNGDPKLWLGKRTLYMY